MQTISLTATGVTVVTELRRPPRSRSSSRMWFDPLRWAPTEHTKSDLITRDEAQAGGMVLRGRHPTPA